MKKNINKIISLFILISIAISNLPLGTISAYVRPSVAVGMPSKTTVNAGDSVSYQISYSDADEIYLSSSYVTLNGFSANVSVFGNGNTKTVGYSGTGAAATAITETNADSIWVTSDDGISYKIINGSTDASGCLNKTNVIAGDTLAAQVTASCLTVVADVNGVSKRPNTPESQAYIAESKVMDTLTGDQYYIFIARDGVTPGSKQTNVGARIIADVK